MVLYEIRLENTTYLFIPLYQRLVETTSIFVEDHSSNKK